MNALCLILLFYFVPLFRHDELGSFFLCVTTMLLVSVFITYLTFACVQHLLCSRHHVSPQKDDEQKWSQPLSHLQINIKLPTWEAHQEQYRMLDLWALYCVLLTLTLFSMSLASHIPSITKLTNPKANGEFCSLSPKCLPFPYFLWTIYHPLNQAVQEFLSLFFEGVVCSWRDRKSVV